jgi:hypothetical protein
MIVHMASHQCRLSDHFSRWHGYKTSEERQALPPDHHET